MFHQEISHVGAGGHPLAGPPAAVREAALLEDGPELSIHTKDGKTENSGKNDLANALIKQIYKSFEYQCVR